MILTQRIVRHNVSADGLVDFYVACNWLLMVRCLRNNINCYLFSVLRKGSVLLLTLGPGG